MPLVVLAMSGGVDSSVAAHLLLEAGHQVIGVFMRHGEQSPAVCSTDEGPAPTGVGSLPIVNRLDHKQGCCTAADAEDARRVSDRLGIPFYALDLNEEFGQIMDYFAAEYARGRTPNPCVQCNNWIKFGKLFDYADSVGAKYVATGHYARIDSSGDEPALLRGIDQAKDQSYVLFGIKRRDLSRMLLPVGGFEKPKIRELAAGIGLNVAEKKDSQEICFVTSGRYDQFVRRRLEQNNSDAGGRAGELVTTDGRVVGRHNGIEGFTVGQRKGLGVALGERAFVVRIEPDTNRVVLGDRAALDSTQLTASGANWLVDVTPGEQRRCLAQIRYNAKPALAELTVLADNKLSVRFETPQFGVAPGQAVVCFEGERVLGGGWIE
ncbi:tRNA-specific 2-thiouridylase MnmA [Posidoniimonas polymericola]|uniref:tRNA-specific 2-thiouridylase MnmA n=1 Tax=Posidoniimonas polymericola TaxID=2528002 RepID=A0A5C5ZEE0_9BACT|nr:tRNA 2-thiouridine(34) synthase MnmA [Posidoniimonas polymericola]TWT85510.1 tRNA-specific 2-thiouridylase MnmA [Posidoniimonas polymericola]